ncbi:cytochrome P450 4V2-like isoform X1 [Pomacea canaliculata]|uniref:cytochrome P450 4V2-like isoform X1 n=2 Tax=Pomacea canaliculata TaxID=400727 RepID=UPI000D73BC05|nr:cytochrome P450 4V2-like isoform X1 [Pomacea canaliculata]XP_025107555.1 cytochrome P450 4V2-like isoform X1 [Pomacea canaliculata]
MKVRSERVLDMTAMGQHVSAQTKESDYVRAVIRICSLLEKRMRTPWHWNKVLYNIFGQGQEHDECREILHDFTQKVIKDRHSTFDTKKAEEVLGCLKFDDTTESRTKRLAFLDMLLYMSMSDQTLSTDDIKEEVETFMFEGHDTTAAAMNWALYTVIGTRPAFAPETSDHLTRGHLSDLLLAVLNKL